MNQYRQGDVFLEEVSDLPDSIRRLDHRKTYDIILAYGEVTGHAHRIGMTEDVFFFEDLNDKNQNFLKVDNNPVYLRHEEHETIEIPPGLYVVRRQREYVPGGVPRVVED